MANIVNNEQLKLFVALTSPYIKVELLLSLVNLVLVNQLQVKLSSVS